MGKKTVQTNEPWAPAAPYILQGLQNSGRVFDTTQPQLEGFARDQRATYGRLAPGAEAGITGAQGLVNRTLGGEYSGKAPGLNVYSTLMAGRPTNNYVGAVQPSRDYYRNVMNGGFLNGNPYLDSAINYAIDDANNAANGQFSAAGRYGSGAHAGVLAREAGRISSNARLAAYDAERNRMDAAAGNYGSMGLQALGADEQARAQVAQEQLAGAGAADRAYNDDYGRMFDAANQAQALMGGSQSLLDSAAQLPWYGVGALNGNVRQASNGYGTQTSRTSGLGTVMDGITGVMKTAGSIAATGGMLSDPRAKKNIKPLGVRPDGLGVYEFNYKDGMGLPKDKQVGVMADEVAAVRPDALGPTVAGLQTVDYSKLGDLSSAMPAASESVELPAAALAKPKKLGLIGSLKDDPTWSKPENARRLFWANVGAASDNPLAAGALASVQRARLMQQQQAELDRQASRDALDERYKMALIDKATRQDAPDTPASVQEWQYYSDLSPEQQRAYREMKRGMGPLVPVDVNGQPIYTPASQAVGQRAYRPPARAGGGGGRMGMSGGIPVITSPAQYASLPSGATFKAPDGTVRRKP